MKNTTTLRSFSVLNLTAAGGLGVLGGIWLIVSPYLFDYNNLTGADKELGNTATTIGLITGIVAIVLALAAIATERLEGFKTYRLLAGGLMVALGVALMVLPYIFDFQTVRDPLWNLQITGGIFILIAGYVVQEIANRQETPTLQAATKS